MPQAAFYSLGQRPAFPAPHANTTSMSIHIYTELLSHIKTLSVQVTLPTPRNSTTDLRLINDENVLEVQHDALRARTALPPGIHVRSQDVSTPSAASSTALNLRIPVSLEHQHVDQSNLVPWTAVDLHEQALIACRNCQSTIAARGDVLQWKDLPSEGWAETMEFWHCHKPAGPSDQDEQTQMKGYSASGRLKIESKTALVDAVSFFLDPDNTPGCVVDVDNAYLCCVACRNRMGDVDPQTGAHRLTKSELAISTAANRPLQQFPEEKWWACRLLTAMENHGVQRFHIICTKAMQAISLWIFAPFLVISSSTSSKQGSSIVMKIMWKDATSTEALKSSSTLGSVGATEALDFTKQDFKAFKSCLQRMSQALPQDARIFQDWHVALIPRFVGTDVAR